MMNQSRKWLFYKESIILVFFSMASCLQKGSLPKSSADGIQNSSLLQTPSETPKKNKTAKKNQKKEQDDSPVSQIKGVETAIAHLVEVKIAPSVAIKDVDVPVLSIKKMGADFIQVIRCQADYEVKDTLGETLSQIKPGFGARENFQSAWNLALSQTSACVLVGEYIASDIFPDLAAGSGDFYYLINPCLEGTHTASKRKECSYKLQKSQTLTYESKIDSVFLDKTKALMAAQSRLDGLNGRLGFLIEKFQSDLKSCENLWAHDQHMLAFKKGLVQLGLTIGLGAAGLMVGPNAAIMAGTMGAMIGAQFVNEMLGLPMIIENTCMAADFKGKADGINGIISVTPLIEQMKKLMTEDIPKATQNLQQMQSDLGAEYKNIISYDELIANASSKGVDLTKVQDANQMPGDLAGLSGLLSGLMGGK